MDGDLLQKGIFLIAVVAFTLAAAVWDFRARRIPNPLVLSAFVLGIIFRATVDGWSALGDASAAFAIGFGTLFVVWITGGGGAGDAKLMGALAVWLGYQMTWQVLIVSVVLVCIYSSVEKRRLKRMAGAPSESEPPGQESPGEPRSEAATATPKMKIAFAIPVAFATWLALGLDLAGLRPPIP